MKPAQKHRITQKAHLCLLCWYSLVHWFQSLRRQYCCNQYLMLGQRYYTQYQSYTQHQRLGQHCCSLCLPHCSLSVLLYLHSKPLGSVNLLSVCVDTIWLLKDSVLTQFQNGGCMKYWSCWWKVEVEVIATSHAEFIADALAQKLWSIGGSYWSTAHCDVEWVRRSSLEECNDGRTRAIYTWRDLATSANLVSAYQSWGASPTC